MTWARTHWKSIVISTVLFFIGVAIGTSGSTTKTVTQAVTTTETETVTNTKTVKKVVRVKVKPKGPAGEIPGDGTFLVGKEVAVGTYRASAASSGNCYWARLKDLDDTINSIIANDNTSGPALLHVASTDYAIETTGCETFHRIG
jgi:hypothetical protein